MITNREEVIDKAFKVFLRMNYEKASISTLAKACGVVKTGVVYYFPHKLINRKTFCNAFPNHFVSLLHQLTQNKL